MSSKQQLREQLRPTRQGARVVIGLFVFGLIVLGGLYLSPKPHSPAAPAGSVRGVPDRKLRIVAYDMARQHPINDPLFPKLASLNPDYLLLQGVNEDDAVEIAETLKMEKSFHPQLYERSQNIGGKKGTWGNLILARQTLYEGAPIGNIRGGFGAIALSIIDNRSFYVANLHLAAKDQAADEAQEFAKQWLQLGKPPMIAVVLPSEPAPPSLDFIPLATGAGGEWFYLSGGWKVIQSGTVENAGTGLAPRWIDIVPAAPATQP